MNICISFSCESALRRGQHVAENIGGGFFRDKQIVPQLLLQGVALGVAVFPRAVIGNLVVGFVTDCLGDFDQFVEMFYVYAGFRSEDILLLQRIIR